MNITWIKSPNFDTNRAPIDRIVIHWIVGNLVAADGVFTKAGNASAHYAVENNTIHQYVQEKHVAYHAGNYPMNQRSIGIEHSAAPDSPASDETYMTSATLIADICRRNNIPIARSHIIRHREVIATQCPGTIDIERLIQLAISQTAGGDTMNEQDKKDIESMRKLRQHNGDLKDSDAILKILSSKDGTIGQKDEQIKALQMGEAALRERISKLEDEVIESDSIQKDLSNKIIALEKKIEELQTEVESLSKPIENMTLGELFKILLKRLSPLR